MPGTAAAARPIRSSPHPASIRRNYLLLALETGLRLGGIAFVLPETVLPRMIQSLGGHDWIIALVPFLAMAGNLAPPLFVGQFIQRLNRIKPFLLFTGLFTRLPYLAAGAALLLYGAQSNAAMLWVVASVPLVAGIFRGIGLTARQEYIARSIRDRRRSSFWGLGQTMSTLIGLAAGRAVFVVLERWPGTPGYGILHLLAFAFVTVSYGFFALSSEPPQQTHRAVSLPWRKFVDFMRRALVTDRRLFCYVMSRLFAGGIHVLLPFLSIYCLKELKKPESFLGVILAARMGGLIGGNTLAAILGDRYGGKLIMVLGTVGYIALGLAAPLAGNAVVFGALFFLAGACHSLLLIGAQVLGFEIAPAETRVSYLSLMAVMTLAGLLGVSGLTVGIRALSTAITALALPASLLMSVSLYFLLRIEEPRTA